jgi:hypothetical protein
MRIGFPRVRRTAAGNDWPPGGLVLFSVPSRLENANAHAREEQQKNQMLFPITLVPFDRTRDWKLFDADRGIDSASEIREYFIPGFSNGKITTHTRRRSTGCSAT